MAISSTAAAYRHRNRNFQSASYSEPARNIWHVHIWRAIGASTSGSGIRPRHACGTKKAGHHAIVYIARTVCQKIFSIRPAMSQDEGLPSLHSHVLVASLSQASTLVILCIVNGARRPKSPYVPLPLSLSRIQVA
jgi:hypothetical protein